MSKTTTALSQHNLISLKWKGELEPVLQRLLSLHGFAMSNSQRVAYMLLKMLKAGWTSITARDVMRAIYNNDAPMSGWGDFSWDEWYEYFPAVLAALQSDDPMTVVKL